MWNDCYLRQDDIGVSAPKQAHVMERSLAVKDTGKPVYERLLECDGNQMDKPLDDYCEEDNTESKVKKKRFTVTSPQYEKVFV